MSDDASDILPDTAFQAPAASSPADDVIPAHALVPWTTQIGHAAMDLAGSVAHGAGTLIDVGRNDVRAFQGRPTIEYGSPESTAAALSKPFEHAPDYEEPDVKEQIRRSLPKLGDQPAIQAALNSNAGQTLTKDVIAPASDIGQAAVVASGLGKGVVSAFGRLGDAAAPLEAAAPKAAAPLEAAAPAPSFDSPPVSGGLPPDLHAERAAILQRVGIENARSSAISGDAKSAATDFQLSRFDEPAGVAAKTQFENERDALTNNAKGIVNETGGTLGTDEDTLNTRGRTIAAPFDSLRKYFDSQKKAAYDTAAARAQGRPVSDLSTTEGLLKDPDFTETLLAKDQGGLLESTQRQFARFKELNPEGMTVENAENFRKWMNQVWTPENSATLGKVKGALDQDVFKSAGEDIYGPARKIVQMQAQTLDNPNGISKLTDFDPKNPLNRTTPFAKIPDELSRLDPDQFDNFIKTLDTMPQELQPQAQAAKAEIKAHLANKILDAGSRTQGQWDAPSVSKVIKANSAKLQSAFADQPETLAKINDLDSAGKILKVDQSYPGAAAQAANVIRRGAASGLMGRIGAATGGAVGATAGGMIAGPPGTAVGLTAGATLGGNLGGKLAAHSAEKAALKQWSSRVVKLSELANP